MLRYGRLYLAFLRFAFSRAMEFRFDFFFRIVMDVVFYAVQLAFFAVIYRHTALLGGWTLDQTLVFACGYMFCDAFYMTVFSAGLWNLPFRINNGELDYYLLRPCSPLFILALREFAANSFLNLVIASGLVWWALARYPDPLGAGAIATFLFMQLVGAVLFGAFALCFLIPSFWTQGNYGLRSLNIELVRYGEKPHGIYPSWLRRTLLTVVPVAMLSSYPAWVLFEGPTAGRVLFMLAVLAGVGTFMLWFWKRGLASYGSASS